MLLPFVALGLQLALWQWLAPLAWFLFYPAVFLSSWIGGRRAGLIATSFATVLGFWFFVPPAQSLSKTPGQYAFAVVFLGMGVAFAIFHERLRSTNEALKQALAGRASLERSLRETNDDLNRAQTVSLVGSWRLNAKLEVRWSREMYRLFGIPEGTPITSEFYFGCVHPDDRAMVMRRWTDAKQGASSFDLEHRIVVGGQTKWVREKADVEVDSAGVFVDAIGIVQDITARKQLEEELRRANALSTGIVSASADAIISIDEEQRISLFNKGAEKVFGYTQEEAIGAPLEMLIPERLRGTHRQEVEKFAAGEVVSRRMGRRGASIVGRRKSGEEFPIDTAISKLEVDGTRVLTVALRDITEQRRAEQEERFLGEVAMLLSETVEYGESVARLAHLVSRDLADWCLVDLREENGLVRRVEAVARDGRDLSAVKGHPLDSDRPALTWTVLQSGRAQLIPDARAGETTGGDGHDADVLLPAQSIIGVPLVAHGRVLGVLCAGTFPSGRTLGGADLRLLEAVAARAALALDNAGLYRRLKATVQERDDVLSIVAHDLRNPLSAVLLQTAVLRQGGPDPDAQRRSVDRIETSVRRMNHLIKDLLDVARMEAGRLHVERRPFALPAIIAETVDGQRPLAASSSLELRVELAEHLPSVLADKHRLHQVFENLIGNAFKFTTAGGTVRVGARVRNEREVLCWVADTGPGVSQEDLPHLFNRFWQARKADRGGAGQGLAITRAIIEAHDGRIWAESTVGEGTTFFFTLPVATAPQPALEPAPESART